MLQEAIQEIGMMAVRAEKPNVVTISSRDYADKELIPVRVDLPVANNVHTLTGLADLINVGAEGLVKADAFVLVESPGCVKVWAAKSDAWGRCQEYVHASLLGVDPFRFGQFMPAEEFVIGLLSKFVKTEDRDYLIRLTAGMTNEAVTTVADDGATQSVATRTGVVLAERTNIKNMVDLAPYRTFPEVAQPVSKFLFRVKPQQQGQPPYCALFEADGGAWRMEAVQKIKAWLDGKDLGILVAA